MDELISNIPDGWPAMVAYFFGALMTIGPKLWGKWIDSEDSDKARLERSNDGLLLGRDKLIEEADKARMEKIRTLERVAEIYGQLIESEAECQRLRDELEELREEHEETSCRHIECADTDEQF